MNGPELRLIQRRGTDRLETISEAIALLDRKILEWEHIESAVSSLNDAREELLKWEAATYYASGGVSEQGLEQWRARLRPKKDPA